MKKGFTLAEVLITLGIIGVVAAMTMPTLIAKYQERETVTKLKKVYSVMSQAYLSATNEYGTPDNWGLRNSTGESATSVYDKFKPFLKISKDCGFDEGCFINASYKHIDGTNSINFFTDTMKRYMVRLSDGSAIAFLALSGSNDAFVLGSYGGIYYDVNGEKGPNQFGVDLFQLSIYKNKILPTSQNIEDDILPNCITKGYHCAAWILTHENMDYRHCPDKLDWNTKTSCK